MHRTLEALQAEVLRLSLEDRVLLLDRLIASLDTEPDSEEGRDKLADERERGLDAGTSRAVPLELVVSRLDALFCGVISGQTRRH